jgi:hypothetical protein
MYGIKLHRRFLFIVKREKHMADSHKQFIGFLNEIRLTAERKSYLITSRTENRKRIKRHFENNLGKDSPLFWEQGSYPMHTIINPLDSDFDLDDGVYLQGLGTDPQKWPKAATVHKWVVDAVSGFTSEAPQDKARCVRVRYQKDYHIDLPIYAMNDKNVPLIFDKNADEPYESDPRAFTKWFQAHVNQKGTQLRSIVRYFKAWRDHQGGATKAASGLGYTILAVNNYYPSTRDDIAFTETAKNIYNHLKSAGTITKPTFPYEDLTSWWDETKRASFVQSFESLRNLCIDAIAEENLLTSTKIWAKRVFGYRFPIVENDENVNKSAAVVITSAPAILGNDRRSA